MMALVVKYKNILYSILVLGLLQSMSLLAVNYQHSLLLEESIDGVSQRIALDLPELKLANPVFNQTADTKNILRYMTQLNEYLLAHRLPIRVTGIQEVSLELTGSESAQILNLESARQTVPVTINVLKQSKTLVAFILPFACAVLFGFLLQRRADKVRKRKLEANKVDVPVSSKLVIDLTDRTLYLSEHADTRATLSNKPLCFYLAMLRYCQDNNDAVLYHNKDLPEEFIELANKYFYRLMELGHSRRKRPDFDSNVDKMLSEIRTALDEIFAVEIDLKPSFFPQKAQGEGSRSKLHNYALKSLSSNQFELIGS